MRRNLLNFKMPVRNRSRNTRKITRKEKLLQPDWNRRTKDYTMKTKT